jgi:aspartate/methionine/tyrosine aminotransferase
MDMLRAANEAAADGRDVVHMEVGQPGSRAPGPVLAAARNALETERIGYTDALGIPELRARIARHYRDRYGVGIDPGRVVVTTGSSGGFMLAFLSAFDHGDRVAVTTPGYPAYRNILASLGIEPAFLETGPADRWMPQPVAIDQLARDGRLGGVLVASPANPTGTMLAPDALAALVRQCADLGLWFVSDEIYHGLTYGMPEACALQYGDDAIVINSFSKYYCMTGWRIGWMIVPERLLRPIECLAQNLYISPPTLSQIAAIAAFDAVDELEGVRATYAVNRDLLLNALPAMGLTDFAPADGAFYLYADVSRFSNDSLAFARALLDRAGVAVTPGADFDPHRGHRYVRMSFAGTTEEMREACRRLKAFLA